MRNVVFTVGTVLTLLALACRKPVALRYVERAGSIVSEVTSDHKVLHDAQSGQTIEWQAEGSGVTDFWIFLGTATPCQNGQNTLHGSVGHPASCVVGKRDGGGGLVRYAYEVHSDPPPNNGYPDRIVRCDGCTN